MTVVMGSPLEPVLAQIFMVHLERTLTPKLTEHNESFEKIC